MHEMKNEMSVCQPKYVTLKLTLHIAETLKLFHKECFKNDHWLHHPMNVKKSNFNSYIYILFLDYVCILIEKIQC